MKISEYVLKKLYIDDELSIGMVANKLLISSTQVKRLLDRFNIKTRSLSDARLTGVKNKRIINSNKQRVSASVIIKINRNINPEKRIANQSTAMRKSYADGLKPWNKDKGKIKDKYILERTRRIQSDWWTEIKNKIKQRDNYSCQNCGRTDIKLDVHHIDEQENHQENNLITLCCVCHMRVHKGKIKI